MKFTPLHDKVLVKRTEEEESSVSVKLFISGRGLRLRYRIKPKSK